LQDKPGVEIRIGPYVVSWPAVRSSAILRRLLEDEHVG